MDKISDNDIFPNNDYSIYLEELENLDTTKCETIR